MNTFLVVVLFAIGILLIVKGGDLFVDAAAWIAEVSGIPKFIVGATIVSFATTLPELLVSLFAALDGKADMAVGNAVGSVTANIGLIMAISIIAIPAVIKRKDIAFKSAMMSVAVILLFLFSQSGKLSFVPSLILLAIFLAFMAENVISAKKSISEAGEKPRPTKKEYIKNIIFFSIGITAIVIGADLMVDNGSILAERLGVPESIVGVTVIAIGTSLPELVTTVTAIVKKQASLSIGNILGANIIDLTMILPVCALVSGKPVEIGEQSITSDLPACIAVVLLSVVPTLIMSRFRRFQGILLLVAYGVYITILCSTLA